ncbi:MAG: hypothetical protein AB2A00_27070 [Myxococcota bacterium]
MKAFFAGIKAKDIVDKVRGALQGRKLGEMSRLDVQGDRIVMTISKLGTSVLEFQTTERPDGTEVALVAEKLALAHRALRGEVKEKLAKVVEKAGGKVLSLD